MRGNNTYTIELNWMLDDAVHNTEVLSISADSEVEAIEAAKLKVAGLPNDDARPPDLRLSVEVRECLQHPDVDILLGLAQPDRHAMRDHVKNHFGGHKVDEVPSRSFYFNSKKLGNLESCVILWSPGVISVGGDMGDIILHHHNLNSLEAGLRWLAQSSSDYLLSKTNYQREYDSDGFRDQLFSDLESDLERNFPDGLPAVIKEDDRLAPWAKPTGRLTTDLSFWDPWVVALTDAYGSSAAQKRLHDLATKEGRAKTILRVDVETIEEAHDLYDNMGFSDFEPSRDYHESAKLRIEMLKLAATQILLQPEFHATVAATPGM